MPHPDCSAHRKYACKLLVLAQQSCAPLADGPATMKVLESFVIRAECAMVEIETHLALAWNFRLKESSLSCILALQSHVHKHGRAPVLVLIIIFTLLGCLLQNR